MSTQDFNEEDRIFLPSHYILSLIWREANTPLSMKKLSCLKMGTADCDMIVTGETEQEVMDKIMAHAKEVHADKLKEMSSTMSEEEMMNMMKGMMEDM